jgi:integrase
VSGKKHRKSLGRIGITEAQRVLSEIKSASRKKNTTTTIVVGTSCSLTVNDGIMRFYTSREASGAKRQTLINIRTVGRRLTPIGGMSMASVGTDDIMPLLDGLSLSSKKSYAGVIKSIWRHNLPNLRSNFNLKITVPERPFMVLSAEQQERLLEVATGDIREFIIMALCTGLRKDNILGLRWRDVDLENRRIVVVQKRGRVHSVPITQPVYNILRSKQRVSEYVWPSASLDGPKKGFYSAWLTLKRRAGLPKGFRFHDLRHTYGTRIVEKFGDIRYAQSMLGHATIVTTQRYAHIMQDRLVHIAEAVAGDIKEPS